MNSRVGLRGSQGSGVGFMVGLLIALTLLMSMASLLVGHQSQQQSTALNLEIQTQAQDIKVIKQSLAIVDEDSEQSTEQISKQIKTLFSEVDKLWASAWRRHKKEIAEIKKTLQEYREIEIGRMEQINTSIKKIEEVLDSEGFIETIQRMGDIDKLIKQFETDKTLIDERLKSNEAWVESINEWRREYNQRLLRLRDSLDNLNSAPRTQSAFEETPL